ncbi:MAG TPA: glycosyl hydrolase family 18 protein [Candidatus Competibacter sp.]|nr:DUF2690 domain-containing protein [Candidatus Competibacteraceae bacterium]HPE70933.1 glycosyl hydrolase family 18 protein [Candidatus Competibacter sp.]HRW64461.1 glycosyl hydrolase family 18 protein [Candidatus Competibacter sp.]
MKAKNSTKLYAKILLALAIGAGATESAVAADKRIIGYFPAWGIYDRDYQVADVPASKLTHINYAFAKISEDGEIELGDPWAEVQKPYDDEQWNTGTGNFGQLQKLKNQYPNLKTLISVGGWTWSDKFTDVALTAASRQKFARSCVEFIVEHGFDGVDIDWEYPVSVGLYPNIGRPEDKQNFTLLLAELRTQLDAQSLADNRHYLLTIAAPASPSAYAGIELSQIHNYLDYLTLMSYDFHGSWENTTNFNAPLFDPASALSIHAAVQAYLNAGVPAKKIVVGVPFYGRGWDGVSNTNDGLYQGSTGIPMGTWEQGFFDYWDVKNNYLPFYDRHWSENADVPWLFNFGQGLWISYDDPQSICLKAGYIVNQQLGGAMIWELSADDTGHPESLLNTLHDCLVNETPPTVELDQGVSGAITGNQRAYFGIDPGSASAIQIELSELDVDMDLLVRQGRLPTSSRYDCASESPGITTESCILPVNGSMVYASVYGHSGQFKLRAKTVLGSGDGNGGDGGRNDGGSGLPMLTAGQGVAGSIVSDEWAYFQVDGGSADTLLVELTDLSADMDLFLKRDGLPTVADHDCASERYGTTPESCLLSVNDATVYAGVHGYPGSFTLKATFKSNPAQEPPNITVNVVDKPQCRQEDCNGKDPVAENCSADAYAVGSQVFDNQYRVQLFWSNICQTNWTQVTMLSGTGLLRATVQNDEGLFYTRTTPTPANSIQTPMVYAPVNCSAFSFGTYSPTFPLHEDVHRDSFVPQQSCPTCFGPSCNGASPKATKCTKDAINVGSGKALFASINGVNKKVGTLWLQWSRTCGTNWAKLKEAAYGFGESVVASIQRDDGEQYSTHENRLDGVSDPDFVKEGDSTVVWSPMIDGRDFCAYANAGSDFSFTSAQAEVIQTGCKGFGLDNPTIDSDGDGLSNLREFDEGTNPYDQDTDHDGLNDYIEVGIGTDPSQGDTDGDGIGDYREFTDADQGFDPSVYTDIEDISTAEHLVKQGMEALYAGLCGDGCEVETVPELVGVIAASFHPLADVRDLVINVVKLDAGGVLISLIGVVPAYGDATKAVKTAQKFAAKISQQTERVVPLVKYLAQQDWLPNSIKVDLIIAAYGDAIKSLDLPNDELLLLAKRGVRMDGFKASLQGGTVILRGGEEITLKGAADVVDGKLYTAWREAEEDLIKAKGGVLPYKQELIDPPGRKPDFFHNGQAFEAKTGYVAYSSGIKAQIAKDCGMLQSGAWTAVEWHFYASGAGKTNTLTAHPKVLKALEDCNIPYVIHLP